MKRFLVLPSLLLGLALSVLLPSHALAQAGCNVYTPSSGLAGPIEINTTGPAGTTVLWQGDVVFARGDNSGCSQPSTAGNFVPATAQAFGPAADMILRTSIPGLAYSAEIMTPILYNCYGVLPRSCGSPPGGPIVISPPQTITLRIRLYKYADIPNAGTLSGAFEWYRHNPAGANIMTFSWGTGPTISPTRPTCSIAGPDATVNVPMGNIAASAFTGVGSTAGNQAFNLRLTCSGGQAGALVRTIKVRATDATIPVNRSQVLSLTSASTARGIGVYLLRGTTPLTYGAITGSDTDPNQWTAGTVATGTSSFTIPLSARYVQTTTSITPGSANAIATFTMIID